MEYNKTKVLIISNNPLDVTKANGKTIESFFKNFPTTSLAQIYLNSEIPNSEICANFYNINEQIIINKLLRKSKNCGNVIVQEDNIKITSQRNTKNRNFPKNDTTRFLRELIWKTNLWKNNNLKQWILSFSPDVIFFCGGDSCFAYKVTEYALEVSKSKLITYITDDYISPYWKISPMFWIRKSMIFNKMKQIIKVSDGFITISDSMQQEYKRIFNKDSIVASNIAEEFVINSENKILDNRINLVYTGGLHYGRYEVLSVLGQAISQYNQTHDRKAYLSVYSSVKPEKRMLSRLNINGACKFKGELNSQELKTVLNSCDIPVFVESFKEKYKRKTRFSFSTKITEYLSLGKSILAIGPLDVESIHSLNNSAYIVHNKDLKFMTKKIEKLFENDDLRVELGKRAKKTYKDKYNSNLMRNKIEDLVNKLTDI